MLIRKKFLASVSVFLLGTMSVACNKTVKPLAWTGIYGKVELNGTCGNMPDIPQNAEKKAEKKCVPMPFQTTLKVKNLETSEIFSTSSDEQGNFRLTLSDGKYQLKPDTPPFLQPTGLEFSLEPGENKALVIRVHSGTQ